ncbi:MAG: PQQ-binding-like beta-propeller repeat protein [Gammaproteobacteria bacterium]|nr:PQQ-binding-like beta-propeller repeat protein [Gammaproteobacteria bacterium]
MLLTVWLVAPRAHAIATESSAAPAAAPGAAVYHRICAQCHEGQAPKAPARAIVGMMTPEGIYRALTVGIMRQQAATLSDADKREVAEYLTGSKFGASRTEAAPRCAGAAAKFDLARAPQIYGWGQEPDNDHYVPAAVAQLTAAQIPHLRLKWAFVYPGAVRARSQPSFAYGALYVGSENGTVYALDARSGCVRWKFSTTAEVRTPIVVPPMHSPLKMAFFGDLTGHVYAVDAATGRELWRLRADDHPSTTITGAPVYFDGLLYVPVSSLEEATTKPDPCCTFRGSVIAVDAATGAVRWKRYTIDEPARQTGVTKDGVKLFGPPGAAIWNTPTLDPKRGLLYVGTGNNYTGPTTSRSDSVLAIDLKSGAIRWSRQLVAHDKWNVACMVHQEACPANSGPDFDMGAGTMLVKLPGGGERVIIGSKSGAAIAVDPTRAGRVAWSNRIGRGSIQGGIQYGMAFDGRRIYVPIADMADAMDASQESRQAKAGPPHPGLYALDPATGRLEWSSPAANTCGARKFCDPGILAAITAIPGAVFAGHMDGQLRAYDAATGRVIWHYDTTRPVRGLGGATGHGGTIGGGGPVVHDGMVYTNSGYGMFFHMPGNVLLAFSIDGE